MTSRRADEYSQNIEAIAKCTRRAPKRLMREHLDHIKSRLKLDPTTEEVDLEPIFKR